MWQTNARSVDSVLNYSEDRSVIFKDANYYSNLRLIKKLRADLISALNFLRLRLRKQKESSGVSEKVV